MPSCRLLAASVVVLVLAPSCDCTKNVTVEGNTGSIRIESNELDFGPVTEFTDAGKSIIVRNAGRAPLTLSSVTLETDGGTEFTVMGFPSSIPVSGTGEIAIDFAPLGAGEDFGVAVIASDDPDQPEMRVRLHGGPIFPLLDFDPDGGFLSFVPTSMALTQKAALLRSVGGSTLTVTSVGVSPNGNPDFSVVPPALPAVLRPGQSVAVTVEYARSSKTAEGLMTVNSNDADAGRRGLRLIPDPAPQCGDGLDNDADGLIDFPDDPGCASLNGPDEQNDPQCVAGAMRACGSSTGACRPGAQTCMLGAWYPCDGGIKPVPETCNGLDDNCDGMSDESISELCTINGCMGARACVPGSGVDGGLYTQCLPIASQNEACNGRDDDCDGMTDEGIVETCSINGCLGTRICVPGGDGGFTTCQAANPATEVCNGIDDDCDGTVDDVQPALQTCGFGPCARTAPACVDGGVPACLPGMGSMETCNGIDDDCNGSTDEGLGSNMCGVGACFRSVPACLLDGGMSACVPGMQSAELCNNSDDDCDGPVDEQADGGALSQACYTGLPATRNIGRCRDGAQYCGAGGSFGTCLGQVLPAASETCGNMIDDNCNMQVDDGCVDAGTCNPNGLWFRDGGSIAYSCCEFFGSPQVVININRFQISNSGALIQPLPSQPGMNLTGPATTCPSGPLAGRRQLGTTPGPLECVEVYFLDGGFVGPNEWRGVYTATFIGQGCTSGICGTPCINQTWPVQAFR